MNFPKLSKQWIFLTCPEKMFLVVIILLLSNNSIHKFFGKLPAISEYSRESDIDIGHCALHVCNVTERKTLLQRFFWNFRKFRKLIRLEHSRKMCQA